MKKIVLLIVFILFLTGCSATYNIEIYNDKVKENMNYVITDFNYLNKQYDDNYTYKDLIDFSTSYPYTAFYNTEVFDDTMFGFGL